MPVMESCKMSVIRFPRQDLASVWTRGHCDRVPQTRVFGLSHLGVENYTDSSRSPARAHTHTQTHTHAHTQATCPFV